MTPEKRAWEIGLKLGLDRGRVYISDHIREAEINAASQMRERCAKKCDDSGVVRWVGKEIRALPIGGLICEDCGMPVTDCICEGEDDE